MCHTENFFQYEFQENGRGHEILLSLQHIRPGAGFEPKFTIFERIEVNGKNAHPVFQFLRKYLPFPSDDSESFIADPKRITWEPVKRTDVAWNFEKFLIAPDGIPYKRYSRAFYSINIQEDIKELMEKHHIT